MLGVTDMPKVLRSTSSMNSDTPAIRRLAMRFHQDFSAEKIDPDLAAKEIVNSLVPEASG